MRRLGYIFSLLLLFVSSVSATTTITDAQKIVKDYIVNKAGWNYETVKVYQANSQLKKVEIPFEESFVLTESSWCFMVDPTPEMKWSHTCKYVCVSPTTGTTTVKTKSMFPKDFHKWTRLNTSRLKSFDNSSRFVKPGLFKNKKTNVVKNNAYAVLISGGQYIGGNWQDGWNEISVMYQALTDLHGYRKDRITVLMGDGTNPDPDMTVNGVEMSSPLDLDGDSKSDINYACTENNVATVFNNLAKTTTVNDDVFVYLVSHGAVDMICLYGWGEELTSQELNEYLNNLKAKSITVFVSACHSGSFVDDLKAPNRTIVTSTSKDESGYVYGRNIDVGTFWEPFFYSLTGTDLKTDKNFSYDKNGDGKNDYEESFVYAIQNDSNASINEISHSTPYFWSSKSLNRTVDITAGSGRIMSGDVLTVSNKISNSQIVYQSDKKVILKKGFKVTKSENGKFKCVVGGDCLRARNIYEGIEDEIFELNEFNDLGESSDIDDAISETGNIEVFPNPTDGLLYVRSNSAISRIVVTDMTGKVIIDRSDNTNGAILDLSSNPQGIYLLNVTTEDDVYVSKIVLK